MPQLTTAVDAPRGPEKNKLELGGIAPHLEEIWGFKCSYFGLHFLEILSVKFRFFLHIERYSPSLAILRI